MKKVWANSNPRGFTLVELLIVIVIIAILAAITVVAYNGIQDRARQAAVQSDIYNATTKLEVFKTTHNDTYPDSITDCPTPADTNLCLKPSGDDYYTYASIPATTSTSYSQVDTPSYEVLVENSRQFLYSSPAEKHGTNEFMQFTDLAPIIDKYGLIKYQLSFDIKSANTSTKNTVQVYFQNGSGAKYGGLSQSVPVTTTYTHQVLTFTPTLGNSSMTQSMLAFYGTYGTGNLPTIANVQLQRG